MVKWMDLKTRTQILLGIFNQMNGKIKKGLIALLVVGMIGGGSACALFMPAQNDSQPSSIVQISSNENLETTSQEEEDEESSTPDISTESEEETSESLENSVENEESEEDSSESVESGEDSSSSEEESSSKESSSDGKIELPEDKFD